MYQCEYCLITLQVPNLIQKKINVHLSLSMLCMIISSFEFQYPILWSYTDPAPKTSNNHTIRCMGTSNDVCACVLWNIRANTHKHTCFHSLISLTICNKLHTKAIKKQACVLVVVVFYSTSNSCVNIRHTWNK